MSDALRSVDVVRVRGAARAAESDRAATEEPLEVRLHGQPFAVIMRTPGADRELAAGFLLAERVITGADDLGTIAHCTDRGRRPSGERRQRHAGERIGGGGRASAGRPASGHHELVVRHVRAADDRVAGGRRARRSPPPGACRRRLIAALPDRLRARQAVFDETGGLHAAGLFARDGRAGRRRRGRRPSQRRGQDRRPDADARGAAAVRLTCCA